MWWQRRPTRADRRARTGTAPPRGGVRGLPWRAVLVGVPVVAAVGWALSLLGSGLVAFLVVDAAMGVVSRRRRRDTAPDSPVPAGG
ncbi:hypothetical protein [Micromonospora humida]|uniref:Uncharacterized protein n=1 Tax=Micromonospora humida TaxID=2809018 RepID=A0ABS2IQ20_9ACTN|nr:hypothetical protein [Micromonospora humida]MBM7076425.1 hypothetical protein [Micromonospora humida]